MEDGGTVVAESLVWARSFGQRMTGLLGTSPAAALVFERRRQIHTFGMRRSLDVLFCDKDWRVLYVIRSLPPRRVTRWVKAARFVVELDAHSIPEEVTPGTRLRLSD